MVVHHVAAKATVNHEASGRVLQLILTGEDAESIKKAIAQEFHGKDYTLEFGGDWNREEFAQTILTMLGDSLANLAYWKELATKDRQQYHEKLNKVLASIKTVLNWHCGFEAQRPRQNADRDKLIFALKTPDRTFGEVAKRYTAKTGKKINARLVERICKRQREHEIDEMIRVFRFDLTINKLTQGIDGFPKLRIKAE